MRGVPKTLGDAGFDQFPHFAHTSGELVRQGAPRAGDCVRRERENDPGPYLAHPDDLSALYGARIERAELTARWVSLVAEKDAGVSAQVGQKPQIGRPEAGIAKASRELSVPRSTVQRRVKIAALASSEACDPQATFVEITRRVRRVAGLEPASSSPKLRDPLAGSRAADDPKPHCQPGRIAVRAAPAIKEHST